MFTTGADYSCRDYHNRLAVDLAKYKNHHEIHHILFNRKEKRSDDVGTLEESDGSSEDEKWKIEERYSIIILDGDKKYLLWDKIYSIIILDGDNKYLLWDKIYSIIMMMKEEKRFSEI